MSRSLNICLISQEFSPYTNWGGIATYNSELAKEFSRNGHRVVVVSRSTPDAPAFEKTSYGVSVWRIGTNISRRRFVGRTIDRILHAREVNLKVRQLNALRPLDVIEGDELGLDGEVLLREPEFARKMVIQCHGGNVFGQIANGLLDPLHRLDFAWSLRRELRMLGLVPHVIVPSDATLHALLKCGVKREKVSRIYHGVDTARFRPSKRHLQDGIMKVGFVGRLEKLKGIDFLWNILEGVGPNAGIRFYLKGAIHPAWRNETMGKLKQFSHFVEYCPPGDFSEMPQFYQSLDVLLQPSRFENFGLAYVEGMASGLIVFAGKEGGGAETVEDGVTGFLVDPSGSVDDVIGKLKAIMNDPTSFEQMRQAARNEVLRRFSLQNCAQNKIEFYRTFTG